ncbi:hypothetical protein AM501_00010 [Aneurinibacillus migulanus]|nr:hypothetical protein TS64_22400 [Aneurinibacillus migulanus]KPD10170.1 hypothetical protein AM501_00010 [Aneurinibacillus migulanus]
MDPYKKVHYSGFWYGEMIEKIYKLNWYFPHSSCLLYTSDLINRQILVVRGKKRRKVGSGWKKTRWPFFGWSAGRIQPLLFPNRLLPTTLPCQNIKCNLYNMLLVKIQI